MIISVLIASAFIGLMLVVLVQGKWTSMDSWFVAILASAVMAMVIGQYVNEARLSRAV
jgi:xanthine/uracil permease